jgi:hypothetical protein
VANSGRQPLLSLMTLLTSRQNTANQCSVCQNRSTWDFLREFYTKVDAAHEFARKLEIDLQDARFTAQHFQRAFADCQAHLAACKAETEEERLSHGETRKDLELERENHKETERLFEIAFTVAQQSDSLVKDLQGEIIQLEHRTTSDISSISDVLQLENQYGEHQAST